MAGGKLGRGLTIALCATLLFAGCRENPTQKAYRQGMQALKRGHYNQSIRLLQKSAKLGGTNVPVAAIYNGLGLAYYRIGQPENALGAFELSARLDPKFVEPVYNAGVIMAESGREAQAVACFEKAAQLDPSGTRSLEYLSRIFYRNQRWDNARKALNEARQRAPREPRILTAMALLELQVTNMVPAISCLQEALEHDAGYAPALYNLAVVNHLWLKNDSQATPLFKDYLRLVPKGEGAEKASQVLRDINKLSSAAAEENPIVVPPVTNAPVSPVLPVPVTTDKAEKQKLASAPDLAKAPTAPAAPSCDELLRTARILEQQGRREAAINNYLLSAREAERVGKPSVRDQAAREANRLCAQNARAHYEVGLYWGERGQPDEALAHLKQAAELSNTWYEAHFAVARVAVDKNEFDTALISLKKADQSRPDRPEALWMLAQLYDRNLGLTNQAIQTYELFEQRFGGDGRSKEGRARMKALKGGIEPNLRPSAPAKTDTQTRWRWLFKSRPQKNPEN
ncbi:MAG: tetratricopeptide repeat protein [Verrucomicrobia bacterium]|nr:tetratricopeptide repeat protein [Verrucomicrobiota bacterium]MBU1734706.1 tetratricopeptide repeat protein [Verrucomicrobiota bacterium]MBU1855450.1 tetratricopeptide repeat protein [Verrucomicrobiota bacterium]